MNRRTRLLPVAAVAAGALVTSVVSTATADAASVPHGRSSVHFHTRKDHRVEAPAQVHPGIAHLRAIGKTFVLVVKSKHGAGDASEVASGLRARGPKKLERDYRLIGIVEPGAGDYTRLTHGTYYVVSAFSFGKASKIARMTVSGSRIDARLPKSSDITASSHKQLHTPHKGLPRSGWLHLQNRSSADDDVLLFAVANKVTYRELRELVEHPSFDKLFQVADIFRRNGGFVAFSQGPHTGVWSHFHAGRPGRYVAALFALPASSHGLHLHKGQVRIVHVH